MICTQSQYTRHPSLLATLSVAANIEVALPQQLKKYLPALLDKEM